MRALLSIGIFLTALRLCAVPEAPRLVSPPDGMELTDVATFFQWAPVAGCTNFELQIARDRDFTDLVLSRGTTNRGFHKNLYFPKDVLPAGSYAWRVRSRAGGEMSAWSEARRLRVNDDHPVAPETVRRIGPDHPLFLMRSRAWDPLKNTNHVAEIVPAGLEHTIVIDDIALASERVFERAAQYEKLGLDFVIWNNRCQVPLATIEWLFQKYPHCIGTAEGEHFWGWEWERGPEGNLSERDFVTRAWKLCAKYGRFYFEGEGEASRYPWTSIPRDHRDEYLRYRRNIVPMFKSTVGNVALHSIGAVEGLLAAGYVENTGLWADEFIWGECGFGALGELDQNPRESLKKWGTRQCPWTYDLQMWLMGIASGATVFQLESAHQWTADGRGAENFNRFFLPFVRAVKEHQLLPSRAAFLDSLRVAVACDYERAKQKHESRLAPDFAFLTELYALKNRPFQEVIPDNSRYGIICLLPPDATQLPGSTRVVPQRDLSDPAGAKVLFDAAYPERFAGDAFMWTCDGTVIVTSTRENQDVTNRFAMPLGTGLVQRIEGAIGTHQYLLGKLGAGGSFWFQTNGEFTNRSVEVSLVCSHKPDWRVDPNVSADEARWDEAAKTLRLKLTHRPGAVEVELK